MLGPYEYLVRWYFAIQGKRIALEQSLRRTRAPAPGAVRAALAALRDAEREVAEEIAALARETAWAAPLRDTPGLGDFSCGLLVALLERPQPYRTAGQSWRACGLDPTGKRTTWRTIRKAAVLRVVNTLIRTNTRRRDDQFVALYRQAKGERIERVGRGRADRIARRQVARFLLAYALSCQYGDAPPEHLTRLLEQFRSLARGSA